MYYDFFERIWLGECACCGTPLMALNRKDFKRNRLNHTRNYCLGGY
jgi:hypothetical protein